MGLTLFCSTGVVYLLSTLFHFLFLLKRRDSFFKIAIGCLIIGFCFHLGLVAIRTVSDFSQLLSNYYEVLFYFSLVLTGIYLLASIRYRFVVLGTLLVPTSLILLYFSRSLAPETLVVPEWFRSHWVLLHVGFTIVGQSFLGFSSIVSFLYLIQENRLKRKKGLMLEKKGEGLIPPLEVLDELHYRALIFGFAALSIGILVGSFWAAQVWQGGWLMEPKQLFTFGGWLGYALILQGRAVTGLRGRRAAWYSLIAFLLLVFNIFGVSVLFPGRHGFLG